MTLHGLRPVAAGGALDAVAALHESGGPCLEGLDVDGLHQHAAVYSDRGRRRHPGKPPVISNLEVAGWQAARLGVLPGACSTAGSASRTAGAPRRSSSAAGSRGRADGAAPSAHCCWGCSRARSCATSARSAPGFTDRALGELAELLDPLRANNLAACRSGAASRCGGCDLVLRLHRCSPARCGSASGPATGACATRPGVACARTRRSRKSSARASSPHAPIQPRCSPHGCRPDFRP